MLKISKKTKGFILIILGILIFLFGLFIINSNKQKIAPPIGNIEKQKSDILPQEENYEIKTTLKINGESYEGIITKETNIYDFMLQLQKEYKINFKTKNYIGMGQFVEEINNIKNSGEKNWIYYVNGEKATIGISNYKIKPGDVVSWNYERNN